MANWHETLNRIVATEIAHRLRDLDDDRALLDAVRRLGDHWDAAYAEFRGAVAGPRERVSLPVEDPA